MTRLTDVDVVLRDAGVPVSEVDGWKSRGRDMAAVRGVVWHHTATSRSVSDSSVVRVLRDGHGSLPGPLSQLGLSRDGTWWVVAAGRANHAGVGQWPGLSGNDDCIGVEAFHAGTSDERWTSTQLSSWRVGTAALCAAYGIPAGRVIGHKEWAPRRKVDPFGVYMDNVRRDVGALLEKEDDDMPVLVRHGDRETVYQVVADRLFAIPSGDVARVIGGDSWWKNVRSLSDAEFGLFTVAAGDGHVHDGRYARKSHGHSGRVTLD